MIAIRRSFLMPCWCCPCADCSRAGRQEEMPIGPHRGHEQNNGAEELPQERAEHQND